MKIRVLISSVLVAVTTISYGSQWQNSVKASLSTKRGNTKYVAYSVSASAERVGDLVLAGMLLKDSEVKLSFGHVRGELADTLYENNGQASFLFDLQARQTFSPFFLSYWEYDSVAALENRTQVGVGLKWRIVGGLSVSLAGLWELEDYVDSTAAKQMRWSLRPKYKKKFKSGLSVNYMIFYKPLAGNLDNYLLEQYATLALATKISWLAVSVALQDKYTSRPPGGVKPRDTNVTVGLTISF